MKFKALPVTSLEDATVDLEQLSTLDILNRKIAGGQASLTFTASSVSASLTITHGLGTTPASLVATQLGSGGPSPVVIQCVSVTATQATFFGSFISGTFTGSINFAWIAIG